MPTLLPDVATPAGPFPSHIDTNGKGGYRVVANVTARDAIPAYLRSEGMEVLVLSPLVRYRLDAGLTTWTAVSVAGADGNTILNGIGAPSSGLGVDDDFYIDRSVWDIYGPKTAGAWGAGTSLIGGGGGSSTLEIAEVWATSDAGQVVTASTEPCQYEDEFIDSHGAWSTDTYTAQWDGPAIVVASLDPNSGAAAAALRVLVNSDIAMQGGTHAVGATAFVTAGVNLVTGDAVTIRTNTTLTRDTNVASNMIHIIHWRIT